MNTISYDVKKYPFKNIVCSWLDETPLDKLHELKKYDHFVRENDQSSIWHKKFYEMVRNDKTYQKIPTFRVHLPGNIAVGEFHKDKHYRNVDWAEKVKETNYYIPLTKAYDTNTIWAESVEDLKDFKPMDCDYGDCIEWDASNLMHGNKDNITSNTRVSFDFRVIPKSRYIESDHLTINTKIRFGIGGYYEVI